MKKMNNNSLKTAYTSPAIHSIRLDHEISLALASAPPEGPDEQVQQSHEFFRNDPFEGCV